MPYIIDGTESAISQFDAGQLHSLNNIATRSVNPLTGNDALYFGGGDQVIHAIVGDGNHNFADSVVNNLFHKWNIENHYYNVVGDIYSGFQATAGDYRSTFVRVNQVTGTIAIWLQDGDPTVVKNLPIGFNYNNFILRIEYDEMYVTAFILDSASRTFQVRWRSNLFRNNTLSYGNFSFGCNGTCYVETNKVYTKIPVGVDYIFLGDSITGGRACNPVQQRWADRCMQHFHDAGIHNKTYTVMASGGAGLARIRESRAAAIAMQPKNVVILLGDNDPIQISGVFNQGFMDLYKSYIIEFQSHNIHVYVITMTPDNNDPHWLFRDYMWANWPGDADFNHNLLTLVDGQSALEIGNGNRNYNPLYSDGGVHPYPAGHKHLGYDIVYTTLN